MFDIKQNLSLDQQCNMKFDVFLLMFTLESNIIFFFLKKKKEKKKKNEENLQSQLKIFISET